MANIIIEENPLFMTIDFFENPNLVDTVTVEDIKTSDELKLFQRPKSEILFGATFDSNEKLVNLNTLYVSGIIDTNRYRSISSQLTRDIDYRKLFHPFNNDHIKRCEEESLVGVKIERGEGELIQLVRTHLKNNHFTILMYPDFETYEEVRALSCLIVNNEGTLQVIQSGESRNPVIIDFDDFLENDLIYYMFVLGVFRRESC